METNHIISLLQDQYQTIGVRFKDSRTGDPTEKEYTYKAPDAMGLVVGDQVVVDSPFGGYVVVIVTRVDGFPNINANSSFTYKWVVQKVDTTNYKAQIELEVKAFKLLQKARRNAARTQALDALKADLGLSISDASESPELAEVLEALGANK